MISVFTLRIFTAIASSERLVVADFNSGTKPDNLGTDWGAWNYDPDDSEQGCRDTLERDDFKDQANGFSLRIDYDVQSQKPAFNGIWIKLGGLDAAPYEWLSFWIRGAADRKFTKRFKLELKNESGERAVYLVENITRKWKEIRIPFKKNGAVSDWSRLEELTLVFDDILTTYKEGTLYLDQIEFQK